MGEEGRAHHEPEGDLQDKDRPEATPHWHNSRSIQHGNRRGHCSLLSRIRANHRRCHRRQRPIESRESKPHPPFSVKLQDPSIYIPLTNNQERRPERLVPDVLPPRHPTSSEMGPQTHSPPITKLTDHLPLHHRRTVKSLRRQP